MRVPAHPHAEGIPSEARERGPGVAGLSPSDARYRWQPGVWMPAVCGIWKMTRREQPPRDFWKVESSTPVTTG